ncbi:hypothetical protein ACTXJU_08880 [Glutamicibacter ardleyensis]|uniref:hypothetical protein n=1 Tax=Glutamicibacter ardleyensis TaxID=225894 RepID=UPI003FD3EA2A
MSANYESVTSFIQEEIIDSGLSLNALPATRSAIASIVSRFERFGWSTRTEAESTPKVNRRQIVSPDGRITLSMIGGKVFRHPEYVERICKRKQLTKKMLDLRNVPTPIGGDFASDELEIAVAYFEIMPKPVVVKPTDAGGSAGVTIGVANVSDFRTAWSHAISEGGNKSNVMVEQFVRGVELRAFIVGEQVLSIIARVQPYVIGDGFSSLDTLLVKDKERRKIHYRAMKLPIIIDWKFVKNRGYDNASIPRNGEIVLLNALSIPQVGALTVDVTDRVSERIKDIVRQAKQSIPALEIAGIDILVDEIGNSETACVLEINTSAALDLHRYPTHGKARAIDTDIVDYFHFDKFKKNR